MPQPPWHGYTLGDWTAEWETFARRAVAGAWEESGRETFARRWPDTGNAGAERETP
jgi:hypothetical protein